MSWHVIRSQDLIHKTYGSNNTIHNHKNLPKLGYAKTRKHGNSPKL